MRRNERLHLLRPISEVEYELALESEFNENNYRIEEVDGYKVKRRNATASKGEAIQQYI